MSIKPLFGEVSFDLRGFQWLILGDQTGRNPVKPEKEWIAAILRQPRELNMPVFMKHNIRPFYHELRQEFPDAYSGPKRTPIPMPNEGEALTG